MTITTPWVDGDPNPNNPVGNGNSSSGTQDDSSAAASNIEYGRVMDIISEGVCHGPVNGLKSFFLEDTPIQNPDGSLNFNGFILQAVKGTKTQEPLFGFDSSENEVGVNSDSGVKVQRGDGSGSYYQARTVSTAGLTHIRMKIVCPSLRRVDMHTGGVFGASVQVEIWVSADGGAYVKQTLDGNGTITGEYSSKCSKSYKFPLPAYTSNISLQVRRVTVDAVPDTDGYYNETWWQSYTEIVEGKFYHPWTAKAAIMVDSRQFQSIPRRSFEWNGRVIKVPSNYTPPILSTDGMTWTPGVYTGNWDGTFKDSPTVCFNPAWQFYDLATNTRFGAGNYLDATKLDKWALYTIGVYCDNMVNNGRSGTEPRFASSIYLQKQEDAIKVLTNLAAAFRGMLYYGAGVVTPSQDKDKAIWAIFTNSNVKDGVFKYSGTARKARHTTCMVSWNDPQAGYVLTPELVEDQASVKKFGIQQLDAVHVGCTSRGGAIRFGQWTLISEQTETETVEFDTTLEGVAIAPGRIIQVNDQFRAGQARFGGRVLAGATTTVIPLDGSVALLDGHNYTLRCALPTVVTSVRPDGTTIYEEGVTVEQRTVTTGAGTVSSLTVTPAFSVAPQTWAQWLLSDGAVTPLLYKVIGIKESGVEFTVVCLQHNPNKYALADTLGILDTPVDLNANAFPMPTNVVVSSVAYTIDGGLVYTVFAKWDAPLTETQLFYDAYIRMQNGQWMNMDSNGASARYDYATPGAATIRVVARYRSGSSNPVETAYTITSWSTTAPSSVHMT